MPQSAEPAQPSADVLVIGSDIAALLAGIDCARIGLRVEAWVLTDESAAREFTHRGGIVAHALSELSVPFEILVPHVGDESVAGIPANPFSPAVRTALGWGGAWRVYRDRITPVLTIGSEPNLGQLVRRRLGERALSEVVNPFLQARYGRDADDLAVDQVAPGLSQAITRGGSLTTGVLELISADAREAQTVRLTGGSASAIDAAIAQLQYFGAAVHRVTETDIAALPLASRATALLCDPGAADLPEGLDPTLVGFVGITDDNPGLESAIPASREVSRGIRRAVLSDPARPPIGPVTFEG
jgi:hypothetical protein